MGRMQERKKLADGNEKSQRPVPENIGSYQIQEWRKRWRGKKNQIFEEDTQHGELEKYNRRGKHEGSVDPDSGEIVKGQRIEI